MTNKQKVLALYTTEQAGVIENYNTIKTVGAQPSQTPKLPKYNNIRTTYPKANVVRIFEDRNYLVAHFETLGEKPQIGFGVFRFDGTIIVERWQSLWDKQALNPSGRSMIDGFVEITDINKTEANKELAKGIVTDILVNGQLEKLASYFDGDNYIQHNPWFPDLVSGLIASLTDFAEKGIVMKYDKIHLVLGEGNFALVISEGHLAGKHSVFYDLFHVSNGKIAEHWDVIQEING